MKHILLKDILIHVLKLESAYSLHQEKTSTSVIWKWATTKWKF